MKLFLNQAVCPLYRSSQLFGLFTAAGVADSDIYWFQASAEQYGIFSPVNGKRVCVSDAAAELGWNAEELLEVLGFHAVGIESVLFLTHEEYAVEPMCAAYTAAVQAWEGYLCRKNIGAKVGYLLSGPSNRKGVREGLMARFLVEELPLELRPAARRRLAGHRSESAGTARTPAPGVELHADTKTVVRIVMKADPARLDPSTIERAVKAMTAAINEVAS